MKKTILSMLLSVIMVMGFLPTIAITARADGEYPGVGTFNQCTGELTSGYYIFGVGISADSISALNTTSTGNWIKFTTTESASGSIANIDTSIVWYYDASNGTFKNGDNYIAWPTTGNSAGLKATGTPLTVTETANVGVYNITVTATPARSLCLNGTSGYRFYTSVTDKTDTFYFFKLVNEQSSFTQIEKHSVTGTGTSYNYYFEMTSPQSKIGTFIVVLYNGQKLVGVKTIPMNTATTAFTQGSAVITTTEAANTYKIMFWSDLENLLPLCEAKGGSITTQ